MQAVNVDQLIDALIEREGGYVDHPADRGGATIYGITEAVARGTGYAGQMRDFPRSTAAAIYRGTYWTKPGFDMVAQHSPAVAAELFDTGVNMGPAVASTFLQRVLTALNREGRDYPDLKPDGRIGPATIFALKRFLEIRGAAGVAVLLKALNALQGVRYLELSERKPSQEAFLFGWLNTRLD